MQFSLGPVLELEDIGEKPLEQADDMARINLLGPFYLLEALTPIFREQGFGHVIELEV